MNSNDLKKTLRPLVKQLVKEAMQEELSSVISEIIKQTSSAQIVEQRQVQPQINKQLQEQRNVDKQKQIDERRKRLEEVTKGAYGGVNLFEGTTPAPAPREPTNESVAAPLAGVDPSDPGVDIGGLLKLTGGWKQIR